MEPTNETITEITNLGRFKRQIKDRVFKTYLLTFAKSDFLLAAFNEKLLTDELVYFWTSYYTFENNETLCIYDLDQERLDKRLYQEFVERVMCSLVDEGFLEMCWDIEADAVIWKIAEDR
jgi:hypothetical protein